MGLSLACLCRDEHERPEQHHSSTSALSSPRDPPATDTEKDSAYAQRLAVEQNQERIRREREELEQQLGILRKELKELSDENARLSVKTHEEQITPAGTLLKEFFKLSENVVYDETYKKTLEIARQIKDETFSMLEFHAQVNAVFVEMRYFGHLDKFSQAVVDEKGQPGGEEYMRTLNAFDNIYHMLRLDLETDLNGQATFVFGDSYGAALARQKEGTLNELDAKQWGFLREFEAMGGWKTLSQIVTAAGLHDSPDLVAASLVLCAIHDTFKIMALKPPDEADHDLALKKNLTGTDRRTWILPSFWGLPGESKEFIIATTEGYNHGWFVQGETSVAVALPDLAIFKDRRLMAFYALHWISDVGGAIPSNPGGSSAALLWMRFGSKAFFPMIEAFNVLATEIERGRSAAYLKWLQQCYTTYDPSHRPPPTGDGAIALMRLVAMAQGHTATVLRVWNGRGQQLFTDEDRSVIAFEFSLTGISGEPFPGQDNGDVGPVFSLKFIPQYVREHCEDGAEECAMALHNIAVILQILRSMHPAVPGSGSNISAILRCVGKGKGHYKRAQDELFAFRKVNDIEYEVQHWDRMGSTGALLSQS